MLFRLPGTRLDYAALPRVTYTDPELAQVGLTEAEARAAGHADLTIQSLAAGGERPRDRRGAAGGAGQAGGRPRDGKLLGAGILAPRAGEMAGMFGLMIGRKLPLSALAGLVVPYPTLAEGGQAGRWQVLCPSECSRPSRSGSSAC